MEFYISIGFIGLAMTDLVIARAPSTAGIWRRWYDRSCVRCPRSELERLWSRYYRNDSNYRSDTMVTTTGFDMAMLATVVGGSGTVIPVNINK